MGRLPDLRGETDDTSGLLHVEIILFTRQAP